MSVTEKTYNQLLDDARARGEIYVSSEEFRRKAVTANWDAKTIDLFLREPLLLDVPRLVNGEALVLVRP